MAHIEIYKIKGRKYRYEINNYRVGKKVKHKKKYLGPVDPINNRKNPNAGRKPVIFIREIKDEEIKILEIAKKSNDAFTRDRAKILFLSSQKNSSKQIAAKLTFDERKVRTAIKTFNLQGLQSLQRRKAPGAIPKFTPTIKQGILMHFSKEPRSFGEAFSTWTLPRFRKHLIEYNVVDNISIEQLRQIIYQAGGKLKRSKRWQYSPDKEFGKKNNE
ncbi:MAG: helix-turn-helix domain-containing protein [Nanoarchaeota archaeon]